MQHLFLTCYPPWLLSTLASNESGVLASSSAFIADSADSEEAKPHLRLTPQQAGSPAGRRLLVGETRTVTHPFYARPVAPSARARRSPLLDERYACPRPTSRVRVIPRVSVPLPFSNACILNDVAFSSRGCRGISLDEWTKLAEKGRTYLGIDDPHASVDELFSREGQPLFQSHWPGYDTRTCYLDMPAHVNTGERAFTKVDLLDMVCQALVDWVLKVTNCRQIECREPEWAIGLKQITFRHIYVASVVEVKGYVSKWVPVLEIDPRAFQTQCQL
ncbi:hypothetical protein OH76DRAFT_1344771 [Lentinus brumalis]|uniref:Uncharacterized protein n=1 Tax=Lentinus brumalis TaxID=2498619 RepID=A0A371DK67_9APHY|nr:hypothetical protein OH76DRAFT_1344771 [Polyporus brumalis]